LQRYKNDGRITKGLAAVSRLDIYGLTTFKTIKAINFHYMKDG